MSGWTRNTDNNPDPNQNSGWDTNRSNRFAVAGAWPSNPQGSTSNNRNNRNGGDRIHHPDNNRSAENHRQVVARLPDRDGHNAQNRRQVIPTIRSSASRKDVSSHIRLHLRYIQLRINTYLLGYSKFILAFCFSDRARRNRPSVAELAQFVHSLIPEIRDHAEFTIYLIQCIDNCIHCLFHGGTVHRNFQPGRRMRWIQNVYRNHQQHQIRDLMPLSRRPDVHTNRDGLYDRDRHSVIILPNNVVIPNNRDGSVASWNNQANSVASRSLAARSAENDTGSWMDIDNRSHSSAGVENNETERSNAPRNNHEGFIISGEMAALTFNDYDTDEDLSVYSTSSFIRSSTRDELEAQEEDEDQYLDDVDGNNSDEESIESNSGNDELDITECFTVGETTFKPGDNISAYWCEFLRDRASQNLPITDVTSFLKYKFIKNEHHVFGLKFRYKMMKAACDLVIADYFSNMYKDKSPIEKYYYRQKSYKFSLPNKLQIKERIKISYDEFQSVYTEEIFRYVSYLLVNSALFDAGAQFEVMKQLEPPVTGSVNEELALCFCPFSTAMYPFRRKHNIDLHFNRTTTGFKNLNGKSYLFACDCDRPMTVRELYTHCREAATVVRRRQIHSPFHAMVCYFLEFQYRKEIPTCQIIGDHEPLGKKDKRVNSFKYSHS